MHVPDDVRAPVPVGAQRQVGGAGPAQRAAYLVALLGGGVRVPLAQGRVAGPHLAVPAALRVDERDQPDVRQFQLARVGHLDREHLVPYRQAAQRRGPRRRRGVRVVGQFVEEVGDDHHEPAPGGDALEAVQPVDQARRRVRPARADRADAVGVRQLAGTRGAEQRAEQPEQMGTPAAGREPAQPVRGEHLGAEPVADSGGEEADRRHGGHREFPFVQRGRPVLHAGAGVDEQPGGQFPVRVDLADVRNGGPGGDRPVHPAYLVLAGAVLPAAGRLAAGSGQQAAVPAVQQAVEPPGHRQLQPAQPLVRSEIGEPGFGCAGHAAARSFTVSVGPLTSRGGGTASITRRTTSSPEIPSAIASKESTSRCASTSTASSRMSSGST